jgi:hypothetical protein
MPFTCMTDLIDDAFPAAVVLLMATEYVAKT